MKESHQASIVRTIDAFGDCSHIISYHCLDFYIRRGSALGKTQCRKEKQKQETM